MEIKEFIIKLTAHAADSLFRTVKTMPEDKLTWKVEGTGRSALEQLQECAQSPIWVVPFLKPDAPMLEFNPDMMAEMKAEQAQWDSVEKCRDVCNANLQVLFTAIRQFPSEKLDDKRTFSWAPDKEFSMAEVMSICYWNLAYHRGAINFIQTLYGDWEMH